MNADDANKLIRERVSVTPQRVILAKAIILEASTKERDSNGLVEAVLKANRTEMPKLIVLHPSVDPIPVITAASEALSWQLAASEAIWSLVHSGFLIALSEPRGSPPSVGWTTVVPGGGGGETSGWTFDNFFIPVPSQVRRAPSLDGMSNQFLSEPDLYLNTLGISNMHEEVSAAFREAVKCFRYELFTAAVTMLGKASEGAWLELGASLLAAVPAGQESIFRKQKDVLEDPMVGTFRKIEAVLAIYGHQDVFQSVALASGIRPQELRPVTVWSDAVRDARNTIHFGISAATPNTYEKLSALLIGAVPNVRVLYRLKGTSDTPGIIGVSP
ncbi:MAG: hypothetical protein M1376_03400 [Planctomycetes bacterium]|nr:hypothetical protein [Planctomycetota bacterium]